MTLVVNKEYRRKGVATQLLSHFVKKLPSDISQVKLLNVEHTDIGMISFLKRAGFSLYTNQYEMAMDI
jgi:ribosomal protein S18 acetylase RimI-like enzyme